MQYLDAVKWLCTRRKCTSLSNLARNSSIRVRISKTGGYTNKILWQSRRFLSISIKTYSLHTTFLKKYIAVFLYVDARFMIVVNWVDQLFKVEWA